MSFIYAIRRARLAVFQVEMYHFNAACRHVVRELIVKTIQLYADGLRARRKKYQKKPYFRNQN